VDTLVVALGCAPTEAGRPTPASERLVTGEAVYLIPAAIPSEWRYLFLGEVTGPFYLAFSHEYACRITGEMITTLRRGHPLRCRWRLPH
jgi:hypothetical protein